VRPLLALPLFCHWFPTRHVLNHDLQIFCWKPLTPRNPTITGMQRQGATEREACDNFWVADYRGLVTAERVDLSDTVAIFKKYKTKEAIELCLEGTPQASFVLYFFKSLPDRLLLSKRLKQRRPLSLV